MMDSCSSMAQWSNIYHHQHGLETPRLSIPPLILDPIHEDLQQEENIEDLIIANNSQALLGAGVSWSDNEGATLLFTGDHHHHQLCSSLPLMNPLSELLPTNKIFIQSQPFDASNNNKGITSTSANSIDQQSLECLLSGTNSNTDTSVEDDGISMLFSDCQNILNFSSNHNTNDNNSNNNSNGNSNSKKRSNVEASIQGYQQDYPPFTISSSQPNMRSNTKRQKINNNNADKFGPGRVTGSSNISFQQGSSSGSSVEEPDAEAIQQMKEMIYRAAAFRPVNFGVEMVDKPKRKNVRISSDPQTVAARQRRERVSEKLRVLQKLVPGGTKMDTASMLDEAANYLKFLRNQVKALEALGNNKVDHYHYYSPNNHLLSPINLQFSSLPFPMQTINAPQFSLQNHNHVPKS